MLDSEPFEAIESNDFYLTFLPNLAKTRIEPYGFRHLACLILQQTQLDFSRKRLNDERFYGPRGSTAGNFFVLVEFQSCRFS